MGDYGETRIVLLDAHDFCSYSQGVCTARHSFDFSIEERGAVPG